MNLLDRIHDARRRALTLSSRFDSVAPLLARITVGGLFLSTGLGKVQNVPKVTAFFAELGIPFPGFHAVLVGWTELLGGALLLVGLASRLAAVPLIVSMVVAILTAKRDDIASLPDLFGLVEFTYAVLLAWIAMAGPGKVSLDHLLFGRAEGRAGSGAKAAPVTPNLASLS